MNRRKRDGRKTQRGKNGLRTLFLTISAILSFEVAVPLTVSTAKNVSAAL